MDKQEDVVMSSIFSREKIIRKLNLYGDKMRRK